RECFESRLVRWRLAQMGGVVVLFDGFDEISPDYAEVVTQLIRALKETRVEQIWVTTRPHWREHLERELGTFAHRLKPLAQKEQTNFLTNFWQKRNPKFKDKTDEIRTYSEALI